MLTRMPFECGALWRIRLATVMVAVVTSAPGALHAAAAPAGSAIQLEAAGPSRELPPRIAGASSEPMIERLIGDPAKTAALQAIAPAVLRFPGGSQANFYDWKSGLLDLQENSRSSAYVKFWAKIAPKIARTFPHGIHLEDYLPLARGVGADVILVPNLETATLDDQTAWFQQLATRGMLPKNIELGNEFWIAMANDPDSLRRWPDEPRAMTVMHRYEQALRPIVGPGAKFAVQAAGAAFWSIHGRAGNWRSGSTNGMRRFARRTGSKPSPSIFTRRWNRSGSFRAATRTRACFAT